MPWNPHAGLRSTIAEAALRLGAAEGAEVALERPKKAGQGDYSTNAAMVLAPAMGLNPRELGEKLAQILTEALSDDVEQLEVAGPGFLNLAMSSKWMREAVGQILDTHDFGAGESRDMSVLIEFVSANPTGPVTAAGGRGAAYGDSLARILERAGHEVTREYYLNDFGTQIELFAKSLAAVMNGDDPPENGYAGAYVGDLAVDLERDGVPADDLDALARDATERMRQRIETTLLRFGVAFDVWSSERTLHEAGALEEALANLSAAGHTYQSDGATWLKTSAWGDDKDRVLIRSDGMPTYFAGDIGYHRDKLQRESGLLIVPLGADHHGYVPRMRAAVGMLSGDPDRYEAPIMQLVNIVERGERSKMSKRRGEFVSLDDLMDDIGKDAARFFLLQRSQDTVIDLDLELARSASQDNPVYYVQYAHARIASILGNSSAKPAADPAIEVEPSERTLIARLLDFPEQISVAAQRRAPHRIAAYATAVAADFHAFYRDCRVIGADDLSGVEGTEANRLGVCLAAQQVIASSLKLLGVSAPEAM